MERMDYSLANTRHSYLTILGHCYLVKSLKNSGFSTENFMSILEESKIIPEVIEEDLLKAAVPLKENDILLLLVDWECGKDRQLIEFAKTSRGSIIVVNYSETLIQDISWAEDVVQIKQLNRFTIGYILELISRRLELKIKLKKSNQALRVLERRDHTPAVTFDKEGRVLSANKRFIEMLGFDNSEHLKVKYRASFTEYNHNIWPVLDDFLRRTVTGFETCKVPLVDAAGNEREYEARVSFEEEREIFHLVLQEPREEKVWQNKLGLQHDFLTDLPNRFEIIQVLNKELTEAVDRPTKVALIVVDIDDFKLINEGFGHESGDLVIKETAWRLKNALPRCVVLGRLGSDEFVALFNHVSDQGDLTWEVDHINEAFLLPFDIAEQEVRLTCSLGSLIVEDNTTTADEAMRMASTALHQAKKQGGGHLFAYDEQMKKESEKRVRLVIEIERGLREAEFEVYYQPIVSLSTHKIEGFEALIRWNHPERGLVPPNEFISIAEKTNLIIPMGRWLLNEVCHQTRKWNQIQRLFASVNASPNQFLKGNFLEDVIISLEETGLERSLLKIEITESLAVKNMEYGKKVLNDLSMMGVDVSMDDFGTGYSSLAYLRSFPFKTLKIDMVFISALEESKEDREIVKAIITMAKSLNLKTIAEGVETEYQKQFLIDNGCDSFQGYLFSKPLPGEQFEALLRSESSSI